MINKIFIIFRRVFTNFERKKNLSSKDVDDRYQKNGGNELDLDMKVCLLKKEQKLVKKVLINLN